MRSRRALGYARVSSAEQALGTSLRDQQNTIAAYAKSRGIALAHVYVEAESGIREKQERRAQMIALLRDVREGDLVLCDKLDRWSRDTEFTLRTVREIQEAGATFYAVGDACDPSTPDGDVMLTMRAMMAKEEAKRIRVRTVGTRRLLRNAGYYSEGPVPFGYLRPPQSADRASRNVLVLDPPKAEIVRRVFAMCAAGRPLVEIAKAVDRPKHHVYQLLLKRVYLGSMIDAQGKTIQGRHPAIVDADTFARAAATLAARRLGGARPRSAPSATAGWFLRDVGRCGCGALMRSAYGHHGKTGARNFYLRCSKRCGLPYMRVEDAEAAAEPLILDRLGELRFALSKPPSTPAAKKPIETGDKRKKLVIRRDRFLEQHADGLIDTATLRAKLAAVDAGLLELDAEEGAARRPSPLADPKVRRAALKSVETIARVWHAATGEERRRMVNLIALELRVQAGKKARAVWRPIEDLTADMQ